MADDLVKRLRAGVRPYDTITLAGVKHDPRCLEAADRIESLEAALQAADECINAMNFTVAIAHKFDWGDGSAIALLDEILSAQNRAIAAYRKARGGET